MEALNKDAQRTSFGAKELSEDKCNEIMEFKKTTVKEEPAERNTRWVTIYDSVAASRRYMEVEVDECANANFITRDMAATRRLQVRSLGSKPFRGETEDGSVFCYTYATVNLFVGSHDKHRLLEADFYILPENNPLTGRRVDNPIVCRRLLQEAGHLLVRSILDTQPRPQR